MFLPTVYKMQNTFPGIVKITKNHFIVENKKGTHFILQNNKNAIFVPIHVDFGNSCTAMYFHSFPINFSFTNCSYASFCTGF